MYEPHRPYPFAALLVLCLALCADTALAGATGGWGEGAGPAQPDTVPWGTTYTHARLKVSFSDPVEACKALITSGSFTSPQNVTFITFREVGLSCVYSTDLRTPEREMYFLSLVKKIGSCPSGYYQLGKNCVKECPSDHEKKQAFV